MAHSLLEMFVEQQRGLKLDMLKILRNPYAAYKNQDGVSSFQVNDTVLKIDQDKEDEKIKDEK